MDSIIGKRLKELRSERNISQCALAQQVGLSKSAYSRFETGEREPLTSHIIMFSNFYKVSTDYILGLSDEKEYKIDSTQCTNNIFDLSDHEKELVCAYRKHPEFQIAIDTMLNITDSDAKAKKTG